MSPHQSDIFENGLPTAATGVRFKLLASVRVAESAHRVSHPAAKDDDEPKQRPAPRANSLRARPQTPPIHATGRVLVDSDNLLPDLGSLKVDDRDAPPPPPLPARKPSQTEVHAESDDYPCEEFEWDELDAVMRNTDTRIESWQGATEDMRALYILGETIGDHEGGEPWRKAFDSFLPASLQYLATTPVKTSTATPMLLRIPLSPVP